MLEFNNTHIVTGQIKQILSSFNLPKYRIYTKENQEYFDKYHKEKDIIPTIKRTRSSTGFPIEMQYFPYIKNGIIQYYICENVGTEQEKYYWEPAYTDPTTKTTPIKYIYNYAQLNWTKRLKINSRIYDSYTHEYLGDYLRFKRDYEDIDLMPLYNCFSNRICTSLDYKFKLKIDNTENSLEIVFNTNNKNFKIYMVPVKLFKNYTIAIDCSDKIELCCGIYGKYQDTREKLSAIPELTYKKYNKSSFGQPFLYDGLTLLNDLISATSITDLAECEKDLKLFIKVPTNNTSSITILEGDYRNYNDSILKYVAISNSTAKNLYRSQNYTVTNFDTTINDFANFKPITPLQLLRINTNTSYPFADRLIEYLLENAIDSNEEIIDNIKRTKTVINLNNKYSDNAYKVWNQDTKTYDIKYGTLRDELVQADLSTWNNLIRPIVYDKFNTTVASNNNDTNHDILGYVDKDIEKYYGANIGKKDAPVYKTILNVDLYTTDDGLYCSDVEENK